ncbi:MAG: prepilin-type N-terminal cleavage/methylation domain-containing protein [Burkholderiales bacterium]|nr:prepilin-type N-terminal cleavage/methylation domain-containing protein [Burkholderiales bacterium]
MRPPFIEIARPGRTRHQGFTLVEMIISLTLLAILSTAVMPMVKVPMDAYMAATARTRVTTDLDWVQSKLGADFATALPNSVRVKAAGTRYFIEFLPVHAQGRYRSNTSGAAQICPATPACGGATVADALEFGAAPACTETCFFSLGPLTPVGNAAVVPGTDLVVVNPTNTLGATGDPYANAGPGVQSIKAPLLAAVFNAARYGSQITMTPNAFPIGSAAKRFYVIGASPVTYECDTVSGTLIRHWGYAISPVQPVAFGAGLPSATLSTAVACNITSTATSVSAYEPAGVRGRGGVVTLKMTLTTPGNGTSVPEQAELVFSSAVNDG